MLCLFFPFVFAKTGEGTVFNFSRIEKTDIALNLNDTIPFSYLDRRIIALSYLNDSIQANIMLDSGAPYLFLDSLFLPKVGLYTQPQSKEYFGSLESEGAVYYLLEKRNGENYWKSSLDLKTNGAVFQIDHPLCSNLSSFGVDGILGLRLLKRTNKIVNINMKDKFITYFLFLPDKYRSLPMTEDKYSSAPLVKLNIKVMTSGGIVEHSGMFMLDTGFPGGIMFSHKVKKKYSSSLFKESKFLISLTDTLAVNSSRIDNNSVTWEGMTFSPVDIVFNSNTSPSLEGLEGVIGMQFLENLNMGFDYENKKFYYCPVSSKVLSNPEVNIFKKSGLAINWLIYKTGKYPFIIVDHIIKGQRADLSGVDLRDIVISIDGQDIYSMESEQIEELVKKASSVTIKTQGGEIVVLN